MNYDELIRRSKEIYDEAARTGQDRFARVLAGDWHRQYYRFGEILHFMDALDARTTTVLDIGCGNGEFLNYLNFHGFVGSYHGIDVNVRLVEEAKKTFPFAAFTVTDLMKEPRSWVHGARYAVRRARGGKIQRNLEGYP